MGTLLRLAMIVGVLVIVFLVLPEGNGPVASTRQKAEQKLGAAAEQARRALSDVEVEAIGKELRETGRVVRRRSSHAVRTLAEATEDMRTTAAIEAQYVIDPRLQRAHDRGRHPLGRRHARWPRRHRRGRGSRDRARDAAPERSRGDLDAAGRTAGRGSAAALAHAVALLTQSASGARPNGTPLAPGIPGSCRPRERGGAHSSSRSELVQEELMRRFGIVGLALAAALGWQSRRRGPTPTTPGSRPRSRSRCSPPTA